MTPTQSGSGPEAQRCAASCVAIVDPPNDRAAVPATVANLARRGDAADPGERRSDTTSALLDTGMGPAVYSAAAETLPAASDASSHRDAARALLAARELGANTQTALTPAAGDARCPLYSALAAYADSDARRGAVCSMAAAATVAVHDQRADASASAAACGPRSVLRSVPAEAGKRTRADDDVREGQPPPARRRIRGKQKPRRAADGELPGACRSSACSQAVPSGAAG